MHTRRLPVLAVLSLLLPSASIVEAQTASEVIEKSIAALGGREAHAKIKSRRMTGQISISTGAGDITGTIEGLNAAPNKSRTLIKADLTAFGAGQLELDQRFDGSTGYAMDSLQGNREITGGQLQGMKNNAFPHPFLGYKELGMSVKLSGKEKVGDREALALIFEPTSGANVRYFIDAETFLPIRMVSTVDVPQLGKEVEQTTDFSDFRDVDGVKVPFRLRASSSIQSFTVTADKVEHNVTVDEKLFVKPSGPESQR